MKHRSSICRPALLGLLSLSLSLGLAHGQQPKDHAGEDIESSDPFTKGGTATPATKNPGAEMLDAQARVLFERGDKEKAIALQAQALEKAKEMVSKYSETLAKYEGRPVDGPIPRKLREIVIPAIQFQDVTVREAMDFLRIRAMELDTAEADPAKKGINIVIGSMKFSQPMVLAGDGSPIINELRLRNVSLGDALKYICETTQTRYKIDGNAVVILPAVDP